jgi:predicted nucleic acid-binding protein
MTRVALDSNILVYMAGVSRAAEDEGKIVRARDLIAKVSKAVSLVVPAQALGEVFNVMRRSGVSAKEAREILMEFASAFGIVASEERTMVAAADLVVDHKLQFWDALILSAAADAGCVLLLSEDMQDGFVARGVTVVNPFSRSPHVKLDKLLSTAE